MPLQIRRGTDAERLGSFTPVEGELIYTTDTKKLYVGDGATVGGVAIDTVGSGGGGGGASVLNDLSDVIIGALNAGDVLKWNGANWAGDTVGGVASLDDLSDVIIENAIPGSILQYDGVHWTVGADTTGMSVLTDDSSPSLGGNLNLNSSSITGNGDINITGTITAPQFTGNLTGDVLADDDTTVLVNHRTRTFNGDLTGDVTGNLNGDVNGSLFADDSELLVDGVRGRVVCNVDNETITTEEFLLQNATLPKITSKLISTGDLSAYSGLVSEIGFETEGSNGNTSYARIQSYTNGIIITANDDGTHPAETLHTFTKSGVAIGGVNPTAKLDVRGAIKPGVYADATARDTDITSPVEGMMVFLQDTQKMQVYVSDTGLAGSGPSNSTADWYDMY